MTIKNMVNELVEIGFENASEALKFAGFTRRTDEHDADLKDAQDYIRGLSIDDATKDELLWKTITIEENVCDRVSECAEEYFRAGVCFVLNFIFDAINFQKNLEQKLNAKK